MTEQFTDFVTDQDDLAGELDDDDNDPTGDDALVQHDEAPHYFGGIVHDGPEPYNGRLLVSRYPGGVLLVDKMAQRAWLLDFDAAGGQFRCRDAAGVPLDHDGRWRAAEGPDYEVRAYDPEFTGDEVPGPADDCDMPGCDDDGGPA